MSGVLDCREPMYRWYLLRLVCCYALTWLHSPTELKAVGPLDTEVAEEVFGTQVLADNVAAIRRQAALLDADERFEFLAEWVLPGRRHSGFRLSGEFSQTWPAPIDGVAPSDPHTGGELVSPMFDLLDVAVEKGRIAELRDRVAAVETSADGFQQRSKVALLPLLSLEAGDAEAAGSAFDVLFTVVSQDVPRSMADQWPETLVTARCLKRFPEFGPLSDLLAYLMTQRGLKQVPPREHDWFVFLSSLARDTTHPRRCVPASRAAAGSEKSHRCETGFRSVGKWQPVADADCPSRPGSGMESSVDTSTATSRINSSIAARCVANSPSRPTCSVTARHSC